MSTSVRKASAYNAPLRGPDASWSATDDAMWALLDSYKGQGALWLDFDRVSPVSEWANKPYFSTSKPGEAVPDYLPIFGGTPTDREYGWAMVERVSNTILAPTYLGYRPDVLVDDDTAKAVGCFGAGGYGEWALSQAVNGAIRPVSLPDTYGAETNDLARWSADGAWSFAAKFRCPVAGSTVNGKTFDASVVGGAVFGGASATANNNPFVGVDPTTHKIWVRNRTGTAGFASAGTYTDGAIHTIWGGYDPAADQYSVYIDDGSVQTASSAVGVIGTDAEALKLTVGAIGKAFGNLQTRFQGFVHSAVMIPSTVLVTSSSARTAVKNMLATR